MKKQFCLLLLSNSCCFLYAWFFFLHMNRKLYFDLSDCSNGYDGVKLMLMLIMIGWNLQLGILLRDAAAPSLIIDLDQLSQQPLLNKHAPSQH